MPRSSQGRHRSLSLRNANRMMKLPSPIVGIAAAALLLGLLGVARLMVVQVATPDLNLREVDITTYEEPPPPPPPAEAPPPDAPPPPPSLTELSAVPDPTRVPVPQADVPMDITLPVETFFSDLPPAPLPEPIVAARPAPRPAPPAPKTAPARPRPPAPVAKSHYQVSELDGKPRLLRHGPAHFPAGLARRGVKQGTVVFEIEISTGGSVTIRRVVSSSDPEMVAAARRVANGARYTTPTRRGQAVKVIMHMPITIKK